MTSRSNLSVSMAVVLVVALFAGCAALKHDPPQDTIVPIDRFSRVAGEWAGVVQARPRSSTADTDWVEVVIGEDGAYAFAAVRTIGALQGQGTFTLSNGILTRESERGRVTATLYQRGGAPLLKVDAVSKDRMQYSGELFRKSTSRH